MSDIEDILSTLRKSTTEKNSSTSDELSDVLFSLSENISVKSNISNDKKESESPEKRFKPQEKFEKSKDIASSLLSEESILLEDITASESIIPSDDHMGTLINTPKKRRECTKNKEQQNYTNENLDSSILTSPQSSSSKEFLEKIKNETKNTYSIKKLKSETELKIKHSLIAYISNINLFSTATAQVILSDNHDTISAVIPYKLLNDNIKVGTVLEISNFSIWNIKEKEINIVERNISGIFNN